MPSYISGLGANAQAAYPVWWKTVTAFAGIVNPDTGNFYGAADFSAVASELRRTYPNLYPSYNPPGVSQLFSLANQIARSSAAISAAGMTGPLTDAMVAQAPWGETGPARDVLPRWQARLAITYTDAEGVQQDGYSTVLIPQVLPSTLDSLRAQMELRVTDQLAAPPGTGTPRSGSLDSIDSITLLAV